MTRATIIGITTLVWSAGFAATGAFVYTVTEPLPPPPPKIVTPSVAASPPRLSHDWRERTIVLPPVDIVGEIPHHAPPKIAQPVAQPSPPPPAKPHEIHCSEWRPLEQGSASVQICD